MVTETDVQRARMRERQARELAGVQDWVPAEYPDPERQERRYLVISVDDHLVEPPHLFEGRLPRKYADRAPRVVNWDTADEGWLIEGNLVQTPASMATFGRVRHKSQLPIRFSEMRKSAYDIHERIRDMNLDGVYASVCFASHFTGFGGLRLENATTDKDFAFALFRAWNDWHLEEWCGTYPGRMVSNQIPWLFDPEVAASEIRRNAERGFLSVSFPESPHRAGLPSLHSGYWDPFIAACAETETTICVHTGSAGSLPETAVDAPIDTTGAMFGAGYSLATAVDWLYSKYAIKFPNLKIVITEGGIGWVPSLIDRLDHTFRKNHDHRGDWKGTDLRPSELLKRNFTFCLLDEPSSMPMRHVIGIDNICYETDFPHSDSSWPGSQDLLDLHMAGLPANEVAKMTWKNAARVFRLDVPAAIQADYNAY